MIKIELRGVSKAFKKPDGTPHSVLEAIDMELTPQRFSALIGRNGSGKTTLLNLIAGLIEPDEGTVKVSGTERSMPKIGYVWQNYRDSLLPWFTIEDNVALPLRARGDSWQLGREDARMLLRKFLPDVACDGKPHELSGGQQQLVSLLRAVVSRPDILLLDEPFSSLDQHRSWDTALYVERIWTDHRVPILFVSHDVDEAVLLADDVFLLSRDQRGVVAGVTNSLPRPRTLDMLTDPEHVRCRNEIIHFLRSESDDGCRTQLVR
jgi:NitT/TauT family transport system ATP-binding protein